MRVSQQMAPALLIFASVLGLCSIDIHTLSTGELAELFTCASLRGQVPVIMGLERGSNAEKTKKIWIAQKLIGQVGHLSLSAENMITWLLRFENLLLEAYFGHIPLKCVSNNSKSFRTTDLTDESNELRFHDKSLGKNQILNTHKN